MGFFKTVGKVGRHIIDVRVDKWISYDYLKHNFAQTFGQIRGIFTPKKATHQETFEESLVRLELSQEDLENRKVEFTRLLYFFIVLSICLLGYSIYLATHQHFWGFVITFLLTIYSLSNAFHFHFWLFQLRKKTLGCTAKDWWNSTMSDD